MVDGADEEVLGGVFEVDEFEELGFVAEDFEGGGSEGIGGEGAEAFAEDAVLEEG